MRWVEIIAGVDTACDNYFTKNRATYALEIPAFGCLVTVTSRHEDVNQYTESTVFVPGVCIKNGALVALDGYGQYMPSSLDVK